MKKVVIQFFLAFLVLNGCSGPVLSDPHAAADQRSSVSPILNQARHIISNLKSTRYSHKTRIDERSGVYASDCSALACYILGKVAPASLASVPVDPNHQHARAKNFYDTFRNASTGNWQNGWQRVVRLMDAEPGDFVAWRKDPMPPKGNTGHIVVVMEKPVEEGNGCVRVVVLDASRSGHAQDTRKKGESGVGKGVMWFEVDENGVPTAVYWSSQKRKPKRYPIAIGRAVAAP